MQTSVLLAVRYMHILNIDFCAAHLFFASIDRTQYLLTCSRIFNKQSKVANEREVEIYPALCSADKNSVTSLQQIFAEAVRSICFHLERLECFKWIEGSAQSGKQKSIVDVAGENA